MTARASLVAALKGEHLTNQDADAALRRLMVAIGNRLVAGESVRLPGVGVICADSEQRRSGRSFLVMRLDRAIGSAVGR